MRLEEDEDKSWLGGAGALVPGGAGGGGGRPRLAAVMVLVLSAVRFEEDDKFSEELKVRDWASYTRIRIFDDVSDDAICDCEGAFTMTSKLEVGSKLEPGRPYTIAMALYPSKAQKKLCEKLPRLPQLLLEKRHGRRRKKMRRPWTATTAIEP